MTSGTTERDSVDIFQVELQKEINSVPVFKLCKFKQRQTGCVQVVNINERDSAKHLDVM